MNDPEFLSAQDVANLLICDVHTVEERTRRGDLPGSKFGRSYIYPRRALLDAVVRIAETEAKERAEALRPKAKVPVDLPRPTVSRLVREPATSLPRAVAPTLPPRGSR